MLDRSKLAVLIQTHTGHNRFLKASLESCRKLNPAVIVCSYNTNVPFRNDDNNYKGHLPASDILPLADKWIFQTLHSNVGAWYGLQAAGLGVIDALDMEWVFSSQGDCVLFKPEGLDEIYARLEECNGDVISASNKGDGNFIGTISYLAKTKMALGSVKLGLSDAYKGNRSVEGKGCEVRFAKGFDDMGAIKVPIDNPENIHFAYEPRGTWGDVLGFVHCHGTEKWRKVHHHEPLPKWTYDPRYLRPQEAVDLNKYWETGETAHFFTSGYWPEKAVDDGEYIKTKHELDKIGRPDPNAPPPLPKQNPIVKQEVAEVKIEIKEESMKQLTDEERQTIHAQLAKRRTGYQPIPGFPESKPGGEQPFKDRCDIITNAIGIDKSYLILGSNLGYNALTIFKGGGRVVGVEQEKKYVDYCNNTLKPYFDCTVDNPKFICSDVFDYMNSTTDRFDCVLSLMLVHNVLKFEKMETVLELIDMMADKADCMIMQTRHPQWNLYGHNFKFNDIPNFIMDNTKFNNWKQIADGKNPLIALRIPLWEFKV